MVLQCKEILCAPILPRSWMVLDTKHCFEKVACLGSAGGCLNLPSWLVLNVGPRQLLIVFPKRFQFLQVSCICGKMVSIISLRGFQYFGTVANRLSVRIRENVSVFINPFPMSAWTIDA